MVGCILRNWGDPEVLSVEMTITDIRDREWVPRRFTVMNDDGRMDTPKDLRKFSRKKV